MEIDRFKRKKYYCGCLKGSDKLFICTTKTKLAEKLGVSMYILSSCFGNGYYYEGDKFIIWRNIPILLSKKGFAIRKYRK
jgi:hypothetical protein